MAAGGGGNAAVADESQRPVIRTTAWDWWAFWILGTVNNMGFVVVLSGAKSLADGFGAGNLIGVLNWADVAFGLAAKSLNAVVLQGTSFHIRIAVNSVIGALGVLGVALSGHVSFAFAVASVTLIGLMSSFGESVLLGYLKYYPSTMAGAWSSGTGAAGVLGAAFYLGMHGAGVSNEIVFLLMLPPIVAYWAAFQWMLNKPVAAPAAATGDGSTGALAAPSKSATYTLLANTSANDNDTGSVSSHNREVEVAQLEDGVVRRGGMTQRGKRVGDAGGQQAQAVSVVTESTDGAGLVGFSRAWACTKLVAWDGLNLFLVYFAEYVISVGCAAKANPQDYDTSSSWFKRNSYSILAFCYQFGVLLSRSSLSVVRIRRIGLLTAVQCFNLVLWLIQARFHVVDVWIQFIAMVFVGLIGGAMYVNVFASLVDNPNIKERDRELCINLASIFNNIGGHTRCTPQCGRVFGPQALCIHRWAVTCVSTRDSTSVWARACAQALWRRLCSRSRWTIRSSRTHEVPSPSHAGCTRASTARLYRIVGRPWWMQQCLWPKAFTDPLPSFVRV